MDLKLSADGKLLLLATQDKIELLNAHTMDILETMQFEKKNDFQSSNFVSQDQVIVTTSSNIRLYLITTPDHKLFL